MKGELLVFCNKDEHRDYFQILWILSFKRSLDNILSDQIQTLAAGCRQEGDQPYVISSVLLLIMNMSCVCLLYSTPDPQCFQKAAVFYPTLFTSATVKVTQKC